MHVGMNSLWDSWNLVVIITSESSCYTINFDAKKLWSVTVIKRQSIILLACVPKWRVNLFTWNHQQGAIHLKKFHISSVEVLIRRTFFHKMKKIRKQTRKIWLGIDTSWMKETKIFNHQKWCRQEALTILPCNDENKLIRVRFEYSLKNSRFFN